MFSISTEEHFFFLRSYILIFPSIKNRLGWDSLCVGCSSMCRSWIQGLEDMVTNKTMSYTYYY